VTVVLAAEGYPDAPRTGDVITGSDLPGVLHAGTRRRDDGAVVSAGGRVLSATAAGASLDDARDAAYDLLSRIELPGGQYRRDIALRASRNEIAVRLVP
jgi:phosphoribosylamine--glycine ligase